MTILTTDQKVLETLDKFHDLGLESNDNPDLTNQMASVLKHLILNQDKETKDRLFEAVSDISSNSTIGDDIVHIADLALNYSKIAIIDSILEK